MGVIRNEALRLPGRGEQFAGQLQQALIRLPNGHLHLGLGVALLAAIAIALTIPIARTDTSAAPPLNPAVTGERAINAALRDQAEGLALLLAPGLDGQGSLPSAMRIAARGALEGFEGGQPIFVPLRDTPVRFTVHEHGLSSSRVTSQVTVEGSLREMGVQLSDADLVFPARTEELRPGMHVYVDYADRLELLMGGTQTTLFTQARTVSEALQAAGYELLAEDIVFPSRSAPVQHGMVVGLSMVRDVLQIEDQPIPYKTDYLHDPALPEGTRRVERPGSDGYRRLQYSVRQVDGSETSRVLVSNEVVWPTNALIVVGTGTAAATSGDAGAACPVRKTVWATYYTAISAGGNGMTATGTAVYKGIIAVDPVYIPLGTKMYVPGYGYGVAADTGGGVRGWHIDLGYGPDDAYDWGSRYVEICIF